MLTIQSVTSQQEGEEERKMAKVVLFPVVFQLENPSESRMLFDVISTSFFENISYSGRIRIV